MSRIYASIAFILSLSFVDAYSQWREVELPPRTEQSPPLCKVAWPDSSTGYVFEENGYYHKSTDCGLTWKYDSLPIVPLPEDIFFRDAYFITPEFFIVTTRSGSDWVDTMMVYTTDRGHSWSNISANLPLLRNIILNYLTPHAYSEIHPLREDFWLYSYSTLERIGEWQKIFMDIVLHSRDSGRSWDIYSIDTLDYNSRGFGNPVALIALDSLVMYKLVVVRWEMVNEPDYFHVARSSDAGKTWKILRATDHPLDRGWWGDKYPDYFYRTSNGSICARFRAFKKIILLADMENDLLANSWIIDSTNENLGRGDFNHNIFVYEDFVSNEHGVTSSKTTLLQIAKGAVVQSQSFIGPEMFFGSLTIRNTREIYGIAKRRCYAFYNDILHTPGAPAFIGEHIAGLMPYPNPLYSGNAISVKNPFQGSFGEAIDYSLTDMLGRTIIAGRIEETHTPELLIALDDATRGGFTAGLHLLRLECGGRSKTGKIVMVR